MEIMMLKNIQGKTRFAALAPLIVAAGCAQMQPMPYIRAQEELPPPRSEPEHLTLGIERNEKPPRLSAKIIDTSLSIREYRGYCWLFYAGTEDGSMLIRPDSGPAKMEFIGRISDGAAVRVRQAGEAWETIRGRSGRPEVLFRLGSGMRPRADALFWRHAAEVCKVTDEPRVTAFYGPEVQVAVVPF